MDHSVLLSKLPAYGIQHEELEWIKDYLFNRKQYVKYGSVDSDEKTRDKWSSPGLNIGAITIFIAYK